MMDIPSKLTPILPPESGEDREQRLRESEQRYRALVTASSDVVYRMSPDWSEMRELDGRGFLTDTAHPSSGWIERYIHPDDRALVQRHIDQAIRTRSVFELEHRVIRTDGTLGWISSRAVPIFGPDGKVAEWIGAAKDVTARKRTEDALHASEERLRNILDGMDEAFGLMDCDLRVIAQNKAALALDGRTLDQLQGRQHSELYPDTDPQVIALYERALADGKPGCLEHRYGWHDGRASWLEMRAFPVPEGLAVFWRDISERKDAEAKLRESEEKFRTLFEVMDEGYLLAEVLQDETSGLTDILYLEANSAAVRLANRDFVGRRMREIDPNYEEYWYDLYRQVALTGEPVRRELHAEPHGRWFDVSLFKVGDQRDRRVAAIFQDVTERKRAETALRESEARLMAAFQSVPVGIAVIGVDGKVLISNAEYRRFLPTGITPSRDPSRIHQWQAWDGQGRPLSPTDFPGARALRGESVVPGQEMLYTDDTGRKIWTSVATVPTRDQQGRVTGVVSVISDIDAAKRSREALQESEERFRQFGENSADTLWIVDAETLQVEYLSRAFEQTWGEPRQRMIEDIGRWSELVHPDDRDMATHAQPRALAGERFNVEYRIVRPDGEVRWIHDAGFPIRDGKGTVVRMAGIAQDVTARRQAEELQGTLLAELQHRVRNILAMLRSIARRTGQTTTDVDEYVSHLEGRISAMARVQAMLTREPGRGIDLRSLLLDELEAEAASPDQYRMAGPDTELSPKAAEVFSLALHELATNSVKYGALSEPARVISIRWWVEAQDGQDWLRFVWDEPFVGDFRPPEREGFGTELIKRRVPYELRGAGTMEFSPEAVVARIEFPLTEGRSILETGGAQGSEA